MDEFRGNEMSDSSAAEREFFEAARVYDSWRDRNESSRLKSWHEVLEFLHSSDSGYSSKNFLEVPIKNKTTSVFFKERVGKYLLHEAPEILRHHDNPGLRHEADLGHMLLETPTHCMPYIYLLLKRGSGQPRAVLMYAAQDQCFDFLDQVYEEDWRMRSVRYGNEVDGLVYKLLFSYMKSITEEAKGLYAKIRHVEAALESKDVSSLSELLHELNVTSHKIRASNFEDQALFSKRAVSWVLEVWKDMDYPQWGDKLQEVSDSMEVWPPAKLKERIADLRVHIDDVRDELRQKREEDRQKWEEIRALKDQERLEESIRIAKETKTDSRTMRGVAWVTMAFLPATFVSSFFGMNFFNGIAGKVPFDGASRNVWLFFAIAVPISGVVLFMFYFWDEHERKKDEKKVDGEKTSTISS